MKTIAVWGLALLFAQQAYGQEILKAEGFGGLTTGGAGGVVLDVTSLEDSTAKGTLRWAVAQKGRRIVRFKTSGIIRLKSELRIDNPDITIDGSLGQDAPTHGITLADHTLAVRTNNVIIRYIRARHGDVAVLAENKRLRIDRPKGSGGLDTISIDDAKNVLIDHVSASWSADETVSVTNSRNVTIQWSVISEPLSNWHIHPYGDEHAYAANNSASTVTYHHNIFYGFIMRGPQLEANDNNEKQGYNAQFETSNNLIYGYESSGTRYSPGFEKSDDRVKNIKIQYHIIKNLYRKPINPKAPEIETIAKYKPVANVSVYVAGNIGPNRLDDDADELALVRAEDPKDGKMKLIRKIPDFLKQVSAAPLFTSTVPVRLDEPNDLAEILLSQAGCAGSRVMRDKVDERVFDAIRANATPKILTSQDQVEGWNAGNHF